MTAGPTSVYPNNKYTNPQSKMTKRKMTKQERDDKVERYIDSALDGVSYSDLHDMVCEYIRDSFADVSDKELNAHIDDHFGQYEA